MFVARNKEKARDVGRFGEAVFDSEGPTVLLWLYKTPIVYVVMVAICGKYNYNIKYALAPIYGV